MAFVTSLDCTNISQNFHEANQVPEGCAEEQIKALEKNETWQLSKLLPEGKNI